MRSRFFAWTIPASITVLTVAFFARLTAHRAQEAWQPGLTDPTVLGMLLIAIVPAGAFLYHWVATRDASASDDEKP